MKTCRFVLTVCLIVVIASVAPATAQEKIITKIDRLKHHEVEVSGFELQGDETIFIKATGIRQSKRRHDVRLSSAWILNAETREVEWELWEASDVDHTDDLRMYEDEIELKKGTYEVYYSTFPQYGNWDDIGGVGDLITGIFTGWNDDFDYDDYKRAARKFNISVMGNGTELSKEKVRAFHEQLKKNAVFSMTGLENDHYERTGLKLSKAMDVQIYAVGEATKEGNFDTSWIVNTETGEKVWSLNYWDSDRAGGAKKNRRFKGAVSLDAGSYVVHCATDDSHAFDQWNTSPPADPHFWGLTIQTADPKMAKHASLYNYQDNKDKMAVLELTELGNDEYMSKGFTVKKDSEVRVFAIGEGTESRMHDYSWIVDADTREVVWEMELRDTEHAGGASKNRVFDDVLKLKKGNYVAYAVTDDSHSYRRWNSSPPYERDRWGFTLLATRDGDRANIAMYDASEDKSIIAELVRVGNNARERQRFELDSKSKVRIYAIGEGARGDMHDFAWIEDRDTGRVVWEMTYRETDHAGGARKNRMYNETITLGPGEYTVFFESDGSHSYNRWNATPPQDFTNWGVTIRIADGR